MTKIRILPIILAAMLSVGANAAAFSATAYAAEPVFEEDTGKTAEQFEDEEQPEAAEQPETADRPEIADQATEAVETVKHPEAADRPEDEEASESVAQETAAAEEEPESAAHETKDAEDRPVTAGKPETTAQQNAAEQLEAAPAAEAPVATEVAPAAAATPANETPATEEPAAAEAAPTTTEAASTANAPASSSEEAHHLAFASDYHNTEGSIRGAMEGLPEDVEYVSLIGDMVGDRGNFQPEYDSREILDLVREVFPELDNESVSIVWATHDLNVHDEDAGIVKCMDGVSELIREGLNQDGSPAYYIYGIGHYDMANGNELSAGAAAAFKEWVNGIDHTVPVIVLCHVPIQASRGDNNGASYWNEALNYAATGAEGIASTGTTADIIRNVLFLHGHNHTNDPAEYYFGAGTQMSYQADHSTDQPTDFPTDPITGGMPPRPPRIIDGVPSDIYYTSLTAGYLKTSGNATLVTVADGALVLTKYHGDQTVSLGIDGNTKEPVGETMTIAAQRHAEGDGVRENVEAPTCGDGGMYELAVYCTICGKELHRTRVATEAVGHHWGKWAVVLKATETAEGREERTCSVCGKTESRAIPMTSPEHSEDPEQPEKPEQSEEPGKSGSPEEQERPSTSTKPGKTSATERSSDAKASGTAASPKTADQSRGIMWMAIMELAVISLVAVVVARRNEERD